MTKMQNSKAGAKLNPELNAAVDGIYNRDTMRYCAIARWIWHFQKQGWPDEAIAEACRMAVPGIFSAGDKYGLYLTKLLPKAKARATATESDNYKKSDMAIATEFVEFLENRRKST